MVARIGLALKRQKWTEKDVLALMDEAEISIPPRTYERWVSRVARGEPAVEETPGGHRPRLLEEREERVMIGWAVVMAEDGRAVHVHEAVKAVERLFEKVVSRRSMYNYLHRMDLSSVVMRTCSAGYRLTAAQLTDIAFKWLGRLRLPTDPSKVCAIDFTYTGHRTQRPKSFRPSGTPPPRSSSKLCRYTNCILSVVWADGVDRTPAVLFTYNPCFRQDRRPTEQHEQQIEDLYWATYDWQIDERRVQVVEPPKGKNKSMVAESSDLVRRFFSLYKVDPSAVILSDNGRSFKSKSQDVFKELGFAAHLTFPPPVHQYLSPQDHGVFGPAKAAWKARITDWSDDIVASISLLGLIDLYSKRAREYFVKNLLIRHEPLRRDQVQRLIEPIHKEKFDFLRDCKSEYNVLEHDDGRGPQLWNDDKLDGLYWN